MMFFEGDPSTELHVALRPVTRDDLDLLASHRNHPETWMNLTSPLPIYPDRQEEWLASLSDKNMYFIGFSTNSRVDVALLRLTDIDWQNRTAAAGVDVFREFRGKHYATPMMHLLCRYAFQELNLERLWLLVLEGNERAINVYKKVGFVEEGRMRKHIFRNGKRHDYILMGLLREEFK